MKYQRSRFKNKKDEPGDADEKPITHQSLEKAKVPCRSCHYELVQGKGEVKAEDCFDCHEYSDELQNKAQDKKLMQESMCQDRTQNVLIVTGQFSIKRCHF